MMCHLLQAATVMIRFIWDQKTMKQKNLQLVEVQMEPIHLHLK